MGRRQERRERRQEKMASMTEQQQADFKAKRIENRPQRQEARQARKEKRMAQRQPQQEQKPMNTQQQQPYQPQLQQGQMPMGQPMASGVASGMASGYGQQRPNQGTFGQQPDNGMGGAYQFNQGQQPSASEPQGSYGNLMPNMGGSFNMQQPQQSAPWGQQQMVQNRPSFLPEYMGGFNRGFGNFSGQQQPQGTPAMPFRNLMGVKQGY